MKRVVVGLDGSEGSRAALRWADEAARRWDVPLVVVWAWEFSPLLITTDAPVDLDQLKEAVTLRLREVAVDELGEARVSSVELRPVEDAPVRALVETAEEDDLLVVGSRGYGGLKGALLGSVSQQVVHYGPCPVTVVRAGPEHR